MESLSSTSKDFILNRLHRSSANVERHSQLNGEEGFVVSSAWLKSLDIQVMMLRNPGLCGLFQQRLAWSSPVKVWIVFDRLQVKKVVSSFMKSETKWDQKVSRCGLQPSWPSLRADGWATFRRFQRRESNTFSEAASLLLRSLVFLALSSSAANLLRFSRHRPSQFLSGGL